MTSWDSYLAVATFLSSPEEFMGWFVGFVSLFSTNLVRPLRLALTSSNKNNATKKWVRRPHVGEVKSIETSQYFVVEKFTEIPFPRVNVNGKRPQKNTRTYHLVVYVSVRSLRRRRGKPRRLEHGSCTVFFVDKPWIFQRPAKIMRFYLRAKINGHLPPPPPPSPPSASPSPPPPPPLSFTPWMEQIGGYLSA